MAIPRFCSTANRSPAGFQLDAIALETVERVELMRSTTAEFSNQAVAGAINIILRKATPRDQHTLGASLARQAGMDTPALSLQLSEQHDGYSLSLGRPPSATSAPASR